MTSRTTLKRLLFIRGSEDELVWFELQLLKATLHDLKYIFQPPAGGLVVGWSDLASFSDTPSLTPLQMNVGQVIGDDCEQRCHAKGQAEGQGSDSVAGRELRRGYRPEFTGSSSQCATRVSLIPTDTAVAGTFH